MIGIFRLPAALPEGLTVTVKNASGVNVAPASLFTDYARTTAFATNPSTISASGEFYFYAASGLYIIALGGAGTAVDLAWNNGVAKSFPIAVNCELPWDEVLYRTNPGVVSTTEGATSWNTTDKTLDIYTGLGGVVLQVGQELLLLVYNPANAAEDILDGWPISLDGASGNRPIGYRTDITSEASCRCFMGIATMNIPKGSSGFVTMRGLVRGLNTAAYNEGDRLWVTSVAPYLAATEPATGYRLLAGMVLAKSANGLIFSNPNTYEFTGEMKTAFGADGVFRGLLRHTNPYTKDQIISLVGINPVGPATAPIADPNGEGWLFAGATTDNVAVLGIQINHDAKQGAGVIVPHVHWRKTTAAAGNVTWRLEYKYAAVGGDFGPYVQLGSDVSTPVAATTDNNTAERHLITSFGALSLTIGLSTMIVFKLTRVASNIVTDTYNADALAMSFDFHYPVDSPGSASEYAK